MKDKLKVMGMIYNNNSYISHFPVGLAVIISRLEENFDIETIMFHNDVMKYDEDDMVDVFLQRVPHIILISMTAGYWPFKRLGVINAALEQLKDKDLDYLPTVIIGGHGPSGAPEFYLRTFNNIDFVVIGEGEETIVELVTLIKEWYATQKDEYMSVFGVNGLAFLDTDDKEFFKTPERLISKEYPNTKINYHLFNNEHYVLFRPPHSYPSDRVGFIESSRGCPFKCNFCYRMIPGIRFRKIEDIHFEIEEMRDSFGINYIIFIDDLLMYTTERIVDISVMMAELDMKWWCNGRLNYATKKNLETMKIGGCVFVNYGIESMNNKVLKRMNKGLTISKIKRGVQRTLDAGLSPGLNILWGNIGETVKDLWKGVDFITKYTDYAELRTIRPVTPYPGCELYDYCVKNGYLQGASDFYKYKHKNSDRLTVNLIKGITDDEFHDELFKANKVLVEDYFDHKKADTIQQMDGLYHNNEITFRGYRQT